MAAGPFSNIIAGAAALLLLIFAFAPLQGALSDESGVSFVAVQNSTPAKEAGLIPNMTIIKVDGKEVENLGEFQRYLDTVKPNETITLFTEKSRNFTLTTASRPDNPSKGYLGVIGVHTVTKLKKQTLVYKASNAILGIVLKMLFWIYLLSIGIGLANLLPIGPVDGGRMLQIACQKITGSEKRGNEIWQKISIFTITTILILLVVPIFRALIS